MRYALARAGAVRLTIYDARGDLVRTLADRVEAAGTHRVRWDGRDGRGVALPSGVFFSRLESAGEVRVRTLVLLR